MGDRPRLPALGLLLLSAPRLLGRLVLRLRLRRRSGMPECDHSIFTLQPSICKRNSTCENSASEFLGHEEPSM